MKLRLSAGATLPLLGLSLLAPASAFGHDPAFVARTAAVNPVNVGCGYSQPQVLLYPDHLGLMSYHVPDTGTYTLNFDTVGHGDFPHVDGTSSVRLDFALLGGHRFVLAAQQPTTHTIWIRVFDPPAYPTTYYLPASAGALPAIDADPASSASVVAYLQPAGNIVTAFFDGTPTIVGGPLPVATASGEVRDLDVTRHADGSFEVYWEEDLSGGDGNQVWLRRFNAAGAPLGPPVLAFAGPFDAPLHPSAARAADGASALVYSSPEESAIEVRLLQNGVLGAPFRVWSHADHPAARAKVSFLPDGDLAVAVEVHLAGGAGSIHLLRFDRSGQQIGTGLVADYPNFSYRSLIDPQVATAGDRVAVAYQVNDNGQDCLVKLRLFDATLFADSFESGDLSAWSGGP